MQFAFVNLVLASVLFFIFGSNVALGLAVEVSDSTTAAQCGILGVLDKSQAPATLAHTQIRTCANHPLNKIYPGPIQDASSLFDTSPNNEDDNNLLVRRDCYRGPKPFGCFKGWCWKKCIDYTAHIITDGQWCWTAHSGGWGDWKKCKSDYQCNDDWYHLDCGEGCKRGKEKDCKCSC